MQAWKYRNPDCLLKSKMVVPAVSQGDPKEAFRFLHYLQRRIMITHSQQALDTDVGGKHGGGVPTLPHLTEHFLCLLFRGSTHG